MRTVIKTITQDLIETEGDIRASPIQQNKHKKPPERKSALCGGNKNIMDNKNTIMEQILGHIAAGIITMQGERILVNINNSHRDDREKELLMQMTKLGMAIAYAFIAQPLTNVNYAQLLDEKENEQINTLADNLIGNKTRNKFS